MASIFKLKNSAGKVYFYGSVYIDGKRYRKKLADNKQAALKALKQFEYDMLFNVPVEENKSVNILQAQISFLKDIELTSSINKNGLPPKSCTKC